MRRLRACLARLRAAFRGSHDGDLAAEIQSHLQLHIEDNIRAGMTPADARRAAILKFGPIESIKEEYRQQASIPWLDALWQDVAYAARLLGRSPGYASAAILSLALGIGANTAIFSILDSLLLKTLPVPEPHQLVALASDRSGPGEDATVPYAVWRAVRDRGLLDRPFAWTSDGVSSPEVNDTRPLQALWADGRFFEHLGVRPIAGRTFDTEDDRRGGGRDGPVAVISHAFWKRQFAADPGAIGRTLNVEGVPFRIVGVTPLDFFGLEVGSSLDIILPLETEPLLARIPSRLDSPYWPLHISGRLRPGETIEALAAKMRAAQPQIRAATMPAFFNADSRAAYLRAPWSMRAAATGTSPLRGRYSSALMVLLVIVALVLLIASANIANLQLARAASRRYEFSVRSALGASRARIVQQQLVESVIVSSIGAALGYEFAEWGGRIIVAQLSTWWSTAFLDLRPDGRVLAVTAALAIGTALLFGTGPAVRAARAEPIDALNERGSLALRGKVGLSGAAVIVQVALSLVLLVGAALFLRSFVALAFRDLGFDRDRVMVAVLDTRRLATPPAARPALYERARAAAVTVPGVESAALSLATPLGNAGIRITRDVTVRATRMSAPNILVTPVSPDWFQAYGTGLLRGRDFTTQDVSGGSAVVIVNEAFALRFFPRVDPLGQELVLSFGDTVRESLQIVGVVRDAAFTSVRDAIPPTVYRPIAQVLDAEILPHIPSVSLSVRAAAGIPPGRLARSIREAVTRIDPNLSVSVRPVSAYLNAYYVRERVLALLSGFFGVLALLLAAIGLYGVTAYSVTCRRPEIAIRMALGAEAGTVVGLMLRRILWLGGIGLISGLLVSLWAVRFARTLLFELSPRDPATLAIAILTVATVVMMAAWLPARRAARIDPAALLRRS